MLPAVVFALRSAVNLLFYHDPGKTNTNDIFSELGLCSTGCVGIKVPSKG